MRNAMNYEKEILKRMQQEKKEHNERVGCWLCKSVSRLILLLGVEKAFPQLPAPTISLMAVILVGYVLT